jgi:hypothetical protein
MNLFGEEGKAAILSMARAQTLFGRQISGILAPVPVLHACSTTTAPEIVPPPGTLSRTSQLPCGALFINVAVVSTCDLLQTECAQTARMLLSCPLPLARSLAP